MCNRAAMGIFMGIAPDSSSGSDRESGHRDADDAEFQAGSMRAIRRSRPIRWLIAGGVLLIAAIAIGTAIMIGSFRERALVNKERELENNVLLLARHFDQQLEDFQVIQNDLIAYMGSAQIDYDQAYRKQM